MMPNYRTIEIDFDVHRCIENERQGFDEPPNNALRRLLKLPELAPAAPTDIQPQAPRHRGWVGESVILPHGTELRMSYNEQTFRGHVSDGRWVIEGRQFDSPSGAASGVALTHQGGKTKLNGWSYWEVKRPGDDGWVHIQSLRSVPLAPL
jgi:hypothetical protein